MADMPLSEESSEVVTNESEVPLPGDRKPRKRTTAKASSRGDSESGSSNDTSPATTTAEARSPRRSSRAAARSEAPPTEVPLTEASDKPQNTMSRRRKSQSVTTDEGHVLTEQSAGVEQVLECATDESTPLQKLIEVEYAASPRASKSRISASREEDLSPIALQKTAVVETEVHAGEQEDVISRDMVTSAQATPPTVSPNRPEPFRAKNRSGSPSLRKEPMILRTGPTHRGSLSGDSAARPESIAPSFSRAQSPKFGPQATEEPTDNAPGFTRPEPPPYLISAPVKAIDDVPHFTDEDFEEEMAFGFRQPNRQPNRGPVEQGRSYGQARRFDQERHFDQDKGGDHQSQGPNENFRSQGDSAHFAHKGSHRGGFERDTSARDQSSTPSQHRDTGDGFDPHEHDGAHRGSARPRRGAAMNPSHPRDQDQPRRSGPRYGGAQRYENSEVHEGDRPRHSQDRMSQGRERPSRGAPMHGERQAQVDRQGHWDRRDDYHTADSRPRGFAGGSRPFRPQAPRQFSNHGAQEPSPPSYGPPRGQRSGFRDQEFYGDQEPRYPQTNRYQSDFSSSAGNQRFDQRAKHYNDFNYGNRPSRGAQSSGYRKPGGYRGHNPAPHGDHDSDHSRGQQEVPWAQRTNYGTRDATLQERRFGNGVESEFSSGASGHDNSDHRRGGFAGRKAGFRPR